MTTYFIKHPTPNTVRGSNKNLYPPTNMTAKEKV